MELSVQAALRQKFLVRPSLDQGTLIEDEYQIRMPDGGQPVRDHKRGPIDGKTIERVEDDGLGLRID